MRSAGSGLRGLACALVLGAALLCALQAPTAAITQEEFDEIDWDAMGLPPGEERDGLMEMLRSQIEGGAAGGKVENDSDDVATRKRALQGLNVGENRRLDSTVSHYILHSTILAIQSSLLDTDKSGKAVPEEERKRVTDSLLQEVGKTYGKRCKELGLKKPKSRKTIPVKSEIVRPEYFDAYMYATFKVASFKLGSERAMGRLKSSLGVKLFEAMCAHAEYTPTGETSDMSSVKSGVRAVLSKLQETGFIDEYEVKWSADYKKRWGRGEDITITWSVKNPAYHRASVSLQEEENFSMEMVQGGLYTAFDAHMIDVLVKERHIPTDDNETVTEKWKLSRW